MSKPVKNGMLVCELEPARKPFAATVLVVQPHKSTPIVAYDYGEDGFWYALRGRLRAVVDSDFANGAFGNIRKQWHQAVDRWLRCSANDCLRARGDIRWQVACRAEMMLRTGGPK